MVKAYNQFMCGVYLADQLKTTYTVALALGPDINTAYNCFLLNIPYGCEHLHHSHQIKLIRCPEPWSL